MLWLMSYLQRDRITQEIFRRAASEMKTFDTVTPLSDLDHQALSDTKEYLNSFLDSDGAWDLDSFLTTMAEITSCSLISYDRMNEIYELHTLVQEWIRGAIPYASEMALAQSTFLLAMSAGEGEATRDYAFRQSLELHVNSVMEHQEHISLASMGRFGTIMYEAGRYEKAKAWWLQVVEGRKQILGENHNQTLDAMGSLAAMYFKQGLYRQAETLGVQVLEGMKRVLGDNHADTLVAMGNLALTYSNQGLYKQAETLQVQVLEGSKQSLGNDHPDTLRAMGNLAVTYSNQGLYKQAETLQVQVLEGSKRSLGDDHPSMLLAMGNLARTYCNQSLYKQAETLEVQVLEGMKRVLGDKHPHTLEAMKDLAITYKDIGRSRRHEYEALKAKIVQLDPSWSYKPRRLFGLFRF
ncbi:hypothetical protein FRC07_003642 [Ceratobasidium sp. 392]|nr:hypothetical protein FRC07_003642 [Ceratobasidium sp. 392]